MSHETAEDPTKIVIEIEGGEIHQVLIRNGEELSRRVISAHSGQIESDFPAMPEAVMHDHLDDVLPGLFDIACELIDVNRQATQEEPAHA